MEQLSGWASLSKVAGLTVLEKAEGQGIGSLRLKIRSSGHRCEYREELWNQM